MTNFVEMGVSAHTARNLALMGIESALPVQADAVPPLLAGRDCVIEAPTGSGKTLAFLLPMVDRLRGHRAGSPRALVVTPTRELAAQVGEVLGQLDPRLRRALIIGGVGFGAQLSSLRGGCDVVVGCPGRILDLVQRGELRLGGVEYLVLDEADEMLDQGFARDVEKIISFTPADAAVRRTVLASATMPEWVERMIQRHLSDPARVRVQREQAPDLEHALLTVRKEDKLPTLSRLLTIHGGQSIVFHRTKHGAKKLARDLLRVGHTAVELQGNLSQNARDRAIAAFRSGEANVLVATNVAARGIDVVGVTLVVNYELPETAEWLTHRVGRTARNGAAGRALTLLGEEDSEQWFKLRRLGAPALPEISAARVLESGEWVHLGQSAWDRPVHGHHHASAPRRPAHASRPPRIAARRDTTRRAEPVGAAPQGSRSRNATPRPVHGRPSPSGQPERGVTLHGESFAGGSRPAPTSGAEGRAPAAAGAGSDGRRRRSRGGRGRGAGAGAGAAPQRGSGAA